MNAKRLIASAVRRLGYEIHRAEPQTSPTTHDAFLAQKALLTGMPITTIFDLGSNVGNITARYKTLFPEATIYSFEPSPHEFEQLSQRFAGQQAIQPMCCALSDSPGKADFIICQDSGSNSLLESEPPIWVDPPGLIAKVATIQVDVTTIDDFCDQEGIDHISILKMDIQGAELMALQGAHRKLLQHDIGLIYTEILFVPIYKRQAQFHEICSFLSRYGYTLFGIYNFCRDTSGQIKFADAIFANNVVLNRVAESPLDREWLWGDEKVGFALLHTGAGSLPYRVETWLATSINRTVAVPTRDSAVGYVNRALTWWQDSSGC